MVRMTLSQLILKLYWDNERLASSDFTPRQRKKVWGNIRQTGRVGKHLAANCHLNSWTEAALWTGASSLHRNQSWDDNMDLARVFLMQIYLKVGLPPDFLNSSCKSNYNVGDHFCNLDVFFSLFKSFDDTICLSDGHGLVLRCTDNKQFYCGHLFQTYRVLRLTHVPLSRTGWGSGM
jgi:hypothetical protein